MYKKAIEGREQATVVRSTVHVRDGAGSGGYFVVVDKASVNDGAEHEYSFQVVLADSLVEDASVSRPGVITLTDNDGVYLDIHVHSGGGEFYHEIRPVVGGANDESTVNVLHIISTAVDCEFWVVFYPYRDSSNLLSMSFTPGASESNPGILTITDNEESAVERFTLDDSNSVITAATRPPPMEPIDVPIWTAVRVRPAQMEDIDSSTFLLPQDDFFTSQVVFRIVESSVDGYRRTNVNTCNNYSRGDTRITLFTCSDYENRVCTPVDGGFSDDACRGDKSRVRETLEPGRTYFVVVELAPYDGLRPRLRVVHRLNRGN